MILLTRLLQSLYRPWYSMQHQISIQVLKCFVLALLFVCLFVSLKRKWMLCRVSCKRGKRLIRGRETELLFGI